ncbi:hypothetical protein [Herbidospora mongoliensis]|uniref:hypothetical protein n=1 Tax=Herbidospora mongoliensis TaxID=688067 RepID=UPI001C3F2539|nr:hypothetical protein [Herbidospora mongoliensis]
MSARITALAELADRAAQDGDRTTASRVHNQAALIASDCGQPDLARAWCHRHALAYLAGPVDDSQTARNALEPLVNLARLHTRAGSGDAAVALLDDLYQSVLSRIDTVIDGLTVPAAALTNTADGHRELSRWLWSVQLADGTRALTVAGRWYEAETWLRCHNGIGTRMLDGRQVAIIARATCGEHSDALQLLADTEPGEPWEAAVNACLTTLIRADIQQLRPSDLAGVVSRCRNVQPDATLVVFRTRLALSLIDAIGDLNHPTAQAVAHDIFRAVLDARDGYAARDLLAHHDCISAGTAEQAQDLETVLDQSGLGRPLPTSTIDLLETALSVSEAVITQFASHRASEPQQPGR